MKTLAGPQSGARGDEVASRNRSGQFLRQRVSPKNPRTAAQRRVRKYMRTFSRLWNKITEPQRTAWCADDDWLPRMFTSNGGSATWTLLSGPRQMGAFVKDWMYTNKDSN